MQAGAERSLGVSEILGGLREDPDAPPLHGGQWYVAADVGDGLACRVAAGTLAEDQWLSFDVLLDGTEAVVFALSLHEGGEGGTFGVQFGFLNRCQARVRIPLRLADNNVWMYGREGAWLKALCHGRRVEPARVERVELRILRKGPRLVRWCQTPIVLSAAEPPKLAEPLLPGGPLLDELGQSRLHDWPGKAHSVDEVTARLHKQLRDAPSATWPQCFSRWGGWRERPFEATGFFRTEHDGRRWWLVDPDGQAFWSAGMDCMRAGIESNGAGIESALAWVPPDDETYSAARSSLHGRADCYDFLVANLVRAFGPRGYLDAWGRIVLGQLRRWGFNTVGNWSDWPVARAAGVPYVRPLHFALPNTPRVFREFPDVFSPAFQVDCDAEAAEQLAETADDPALIGYFLMNEPNWGFTGELPAAGMLHNTDRCATRERLAEHLRDKFDGDADALREAWGADATFERIAAGPWRGQWTDAARADLEAFSAAMAEALFAGMSAACRRADPNHLNLGARYHTVPPDFALAGMASFDVFSMNCYDRRPPGERIEAVSRRLERPVVLGEWHFGALDAGLPASGIGHVPDQPARGQAYRVYLEAAAAMPFVVGAHWFQLYDQSAVGRFDGENYNIGFLDVCHRPYEELARAARASHERMYAVAAGRTDPFDQKPEYLPRLFL